jgi:hypothetical protein
MTIDPILFGLPEDSRRIWLEAGERRDALESIVDAWESGGGRLGSSVTRLDRAIVDGLFAFGLPRGPTREVRVEHVDRGWIGRKDPSCDLIIDVAALRTVIEHLNNPDDAFRTWVHESLHARQPFETAFDLEQRRFRGYEEGLVETLAQLLTRTRAGMSIAGVSYRYYVESYRALADVLPLDLEGVLRRLWQHPVGRVRGAFVRVVDGERRARWGNGISASQRTRLQIVADVLFRSDRINREPDEAVLHALWQGVFR